MVAGIREHSTKYAPKPSLRNIMHSLSIKALTALVARLSECRLNGNLRLVHITFHFLKFKQTVQTLIRRRRTRRLIWVCPIY